MPLLDLSSHLRGRSIVDHAVRSPSSLGDDTAPANGLYAGGVFATARVDHGRWIAECPLERDGGAEFVSPGLPFFCCECRNRSVGHVPIPVVFPDERTRVQIDAYLMARPEKETRNWLPHETVKDLQRENRDHGVRLP